MPIRMTHLVHGVLHAVGNEVEWNLKNGWKVDEEAPPPSDTTDLEKLRELWEAKFGSKPHHKKTARTLQDELNS